MAKDNIDSALVIGLGRFGFHVAKKFNELGIDVMGIDIKENRVIAATDVLTRGLIGNTTNADFLKSCGVGNFDLCVVTIGGDFEASLETTWQLKQLGAKKVIARASSAIHEQFLLRNGADESIYPERQDAQWLAYRYSSPYILDYTRLDQENAIFEIEVPTSWVGKSLVEIDARKKYDLNIIGSKHPGGRVSTHVDPEQLLEKGMTLVVSGDAQTILKLFR
jgi:trk system potassium uptake protein TrkA